MDFQLPLSMATKTFWSPQKGNMSYVFGKPSIPTIGWQLKFFGCHKVWQLKNLVTILYGEQIVFQVPQGMAT
jgi:hypothetical protein